MTTINFTTLFGGITPLHNINVTPVNFKSSENISTFNFGELEGYKDKYVTNPTCVEFKDKAKIKQLAKSNPRIMALLKKYNIPLRVNMRTFDVIDSHLKQTRSLAAGIHSNLPEEMKSKVSSSDIQTAAMLHDYGKILIPEKVFGKKEAFNSDEKEIMSLHSELGYELLKQQGVKESVLQLVKYHHQKPDGSGYPAINDDFEYGIASQILAIADKYSALTEDRCYRKACSKEEALEIIHKDVESGLISQEVFDALNNYIK